MISKSTTQSYVFPFTFSVSSASMIYMIPFYLWLFMDIFNLHLVGFGNGNGASPTFRAWAGQIHFILFNYTRSKWNGSPAASVVIDVTSQSSIEKLFGVSSTCFQTFQFQ